MTNNKQYDHLVFIGRMQPFHKGHYHVIKTALNLAKHVIVLVGSSNTSRNTRNPFTFEERKQMIMQSIFDETGVDVVGENTLTILPLNDYTYNDEEWIKAVFHKVDNHLRAAHPSTTYDDIVALKELKVGLIGHSKDHSSYYLKLFPNWGSIDVQGVEGGQHKLINATDIRNLYFGAQWHDMSWVGLVPDFVGKYLTKWIDSVEYQEIVNEHKFVLEYKKQWSTAPYPPTFVTVDAVVVQSGHVLMVKRGAQPGLGKLAMPGGFLNPGETLLTGALRELKEETKLKVPEPVLRGSLKDQKTYDDPHRSARGRTITTAFLFHLAPQLELPKIKGSDDAAEAMWIPISQIKAEDCFEDHYHIIHNLTSNL